MTKMITIKDDLVVSCFVDDTAMTLSSFFPIISKWWMFLYGDSMFNKMFVSSKDFQLLKTLLGIPSHVGRCLWGLLVSSKVSIAFRERSHQVTGTAVVRVGSTRWIRALWIYGKDVWLKVDVLGAGHGKNQWHSPKDNGLGMLWRCWSFQHSSTDLAPNIV